MYVFRSRRVAVVISALSAVMMLAGCGGQSAPDLRNVTLTLVRHGESEADVEKIASTNVPGTPLTEVGRGQADSLANRLSGNDYDGVFASQMIRTEQTAEPMAKALDEQVTVLPGLDDIPAGFFEGVPMSDTSGAYLLGPEGWINGDRRFGIPGSVNGDQFNNDFTGAVQKMYDSGSDKPIAFSSGLSIMIWTLMNARNGKPTLLTDHPLPNVGRVVVTGNPVTGWVLQEWDGITNFSIDAD